MGAMNIFIKKEVHLKSENNFLNIKSHRSVTLTRARLNMTKLSWKTDNNRIVEKNFPLSLDEVFHLLQEKPV